MSKILIRTTLVLTLVYSLGAMALAQGTTGSILGIVYDQSQAVLPGVTIAATSQDTGQQRQTVSDDQGRFLMAQMKIGSYLVEAQLPGFQKEVQQVTLTLQGDAVIDFSLIVGATGTEVFVTSEAPLIQTSSSSLKGLVDSQQIRDLPLNGRSFTDLAALQTGVTINYNQNATDGAMTPKFNIIGTRSTMSAFLLDGTEMRNQMSTTPGTAAGTLLGVDTVQEFNVVTGTASAEYGGFAGGVISAVTRSGTNDFHGTVFEFHRNSALDARNFFDRDPGNPLERSDPPAFIRNQYGFTLGGPIVRDKLFFFGSFEGFKERLTTTKTGNVPSLDARMGIFSRGNVTPSPITMPIIDAYPLPNGQVSSTGDTADYVFPSSRVIDENYYLFKMDWQVTEEDSVAGRYIIDDVTLDEVGDDLGIVQMAKNTRNQYSMLQWNRIISTRLINEARISYNRSTNGTDPIFTDCCPSIMIFNPNSFTFTGEPRPGEIFLRDGTTRLGVSMRRGRITILNRFQYIDNLSYTTGGHLLKLGFNIHRIQYNVDSPTFMAGQYSFNNLRDLVANNTPAVFIGTLSGSFMRGIRQIIMGFYVQDDWRLRSNLTLNIGLRYEPFTKPNEVAGRISAFRRATDTVMTEGNPMFVPNPSLKNFAPRVGFAWDPFQDGRTSIRAGYGLFYDSIRPVHYFNYSSTNLPFSVSIVRGAPPFPDPSVGFSGTVTSPWAISDEIKQSGIHQYQLSIQRELPEGWMLQVGYSGSHGYNLGHMVDRNFALPTTDGNGVFPFWPAGSQRPNTAFSQMRDFAWDANSFYNSLGITVKKRFSQGYSFQGSYTYGKSIDDASGTSVFDTSGTPNGATHFPFDITVDRGLSGFDVRNRLVLNGSWDIPLGSGQAFGSGWNGALQHILGGWSINGILTAADGNHGTAQMFFNNSRSQGSTPADIADRPNLIPGGDNNPVLSGGRDPNKYFDLTQFEVGDPGYLGNLGRNTIENPGIITLDFSIFKDVHFTEQRYLQFRFEVFNIANRANFEQVGFFWGGHINVFGRGGVPNPLAARIVGTAVTSRQIQFALKLHF